MDTVIGVATAAFFQEFRSRTLREKLVSKVLYYFALVMISYIVGGLLVAYWMLAAPWYAIILIELSSLLELLTKLNVRGGKQFGPAERVLKVMAQAMGEAAKKAIPGDTASKDGDA